MKKVLGVLAILGIAGCASTSGPEIVELTQQFNTNEVAWSQGKGDATLTGQAFIQTRGGQPRTCAGTKVLLLPVSSYTEERLSALYGNSDQGYIPAIKTRNVSFVPNPPEYMNTGRLAVCDAQGNFEFSSIPAGEYFVVSSLVWTVGDSSIPNGGGMMKRVSLTKGESTRAILAP